MVLQHIARGGGASCAMSLARTLSGQAASTSCPIDPPEHLVQATLKEVQALMPFSWQIGQFRHRSIEQNGVQVFYKARNKPIVPSLEADHTDTPRAPSDSYLQLVFPFSSSAALRDQYRRFSGDRPRWGILLEDLDTLAGDIAALHAGLQGGKWTPVTAVVDRFNMMTSSLAGEQVDLQSDLRFDGQVTWVGRSSMEVLITLSSRPPPVMPSTPESAWSSNGPAAKGDDEDDATHGTSSSSWRGHPNGAAAGARGGGLAPAASLTQHELPPGTMGSAWRFEGFARFVMAMRDTVARRAVQVAPLAPETQRERELFEQGNEHHVLRKQKRESHWRNKPPSDAEVRLIHQLAVSNLDGATSSSSSAGGGGIAGILGARSSARVNPFHAGAENGAEDGAGSAALDLQGASPLPAVPMHTTELCSTQLMHSQDRNHFSYIFGGHLMRLAFEHAYTTAAMHAGEWCEPVSMEDVVFISSVPVGCILELRAKVVHTRGRHLRVLVEAVLLYPGRREQVTSNLFSFLFLSPSAVPPVVPTTVVEALEFVLGQRQAEEQEQHDRAAAECQC